MCYVKTDGHELCILYLITGLYHTKTGHRHKVGSCNCSCLLKNSQDNHWNNSSFLTQKKQMQRDWKYPSSSGRCYWKHSLLDVAFFWLTHGDGWSVAVTKQQIKQSTWSWQPDQYNAAKVGDKACESFQKYSCSDLSFGQISLCTKNIWIF